MLGFAIPTAAIARQVRLGSAIGIQVSQVEDYEFFMHCRATRIPYVSSNARRA